MLLSYLGKLPIVSTSDYLWVDEQGLWDTGRLIRTMTQEIAERLGTRLTMQDYW
jgi:hypothetical protein